MSVLQIVQSVRVIKVARDWAVPANDVNFVHINTNNKYMYLILTNNVRKYGKNNDIILLDENVN